MATVTQTPKPKKKITIDLENSTSALGQINPLQVRISNKEQSQLFYNLRQTFNKKTMESMEQSISDLGLETPLLVRKINDPKFAYELIAGERRLRAILKLIKENAVCRDSVNGGTGPASKVYATVDAKILSNCSDKLALKLSVVENMEREAVSQLDMMAYCIDLSERKDENGKLYLTPKEIAEVIGRSETWISHTKSLMKLPNEAKQLLQDNKMDRATALYLLKLDKSAVPQVIAKAQEIALENQKLEQVEAEEAFREAQRELETNESNYVASVAMGVAGPDLKDTRKDRSFTKTKLRNSKKRRDAANEKTPRLTKDDLQEAATKEGSIRKKTAPISVKTIRTRRDVLLKEFNTGVIKSGENQYELRDVELVLAVCDGVLGAEGEFQPLAILDNLYKKWQKPGWDAA